MGSMNNWEWATFKSEVKLKWVSGSKSTYEDIKFEKVNNLVHNLGFALGIYHISWHLTKIENYGSYQISIKNITYCLI